MEQGAKVRLRPLSELTPEDGEVLIAFGPQCWISSRLRVIEDCERSKPGHKMNILGWIPLPEIEVAD
jgi:hypothetical protein